MTKSINFVQNGDWAASARAFLSWVKNEHGIQLPKDFDGFLSTPGYFDELITGFFGEFENGNRISALRALDIALSTNSTPPAFATEFFSHLLSEYLSGTSIEVILGAVPGRTGQMNVPVNRYRQNYQDACKLAAMLRADYGGSLGKARIRRAQAILGEMRIFKGIGDTRLANIWRKTDRTNSRYQISNAQFVLILNQVHIVESKTARTD